MKFSLRKKNNANQIVVQGLNKNVIMYIYNECQKYSPTTLSTFVVFYQTLTKQTADFHTFYSIEHVDNYIQRSLPYNFLSSFLSD